MKRRLLAAVAAAAILYGTSRPAYAILGVGDIVFDPAAVTELVQEAKNGLTQITWLSDLYTTAQDTLKPITGIYDTTQKELAQLTTLYNAFAHVTNAAQLVQALNSNFIHEPMLANAVQLEQAFRGMGLTTSLMSKIQTLMNQIQYYKPSNNDFAGWHLNNRTSATAGQIASAQDAYTAATQNVIGLQQLMPSITTNDPKMVADLTARGTIETAKAVASGNQLLAAQMLQQAQKDVAHQQDEQAYRFSVDQLHASAQRAIAAAQAGSVNLVTQ
jgi:hypothetical protein